MTQFNTIKNKNINLLPQCILIIYINVSIVNITCCYSNLIEKQVTLCVNNVQKRKNNIFLAIFLALEVQRKK